MTIYLRELTDVEEEHIFIGKGYHFVIKKGWMGGEFTASTKKWMPKFVGD